MLRELLASLADNTLEQKLKIFLVPEILLIDELGFDRLEQHDARNACLFHKVIDGRYCKGSTIITSNVDFKELGDYLGDPVITAATVDRMIHHSVIISIEGPSWRLYESKRAERNKVTPPIDSSLSKKKQRQASIRSLPLLFNAIFADHGEMVSHIECISQRFTEINWQLTGLGEP